MANAKRDDNRVPTLLAADSSDLTAAPVKLAADPTTNRLLVTATVSGSVTTVDDTVSTSTDVSLASSATSAQLIASNTSRKGLVLNNTDANPVYVYYGTTATATKFTVRIPPNSYWEMPQPVYTGRIDAIWSADGSGSLIGSEL